MGLNRCHSFAWFTPASGLAHMTPLLFVSPSAEYVPDQPDNTRCTAAEAPGVLAAWAPGTRAIVPVNYSEYHPAGWIGHRDPSNGVLTYFDTLTDGLPSPWLVNSRANLTALFTTLGQTLRAANAANTAPLLEGMFLDFEPATVTFLDFQIASRVALAAHASWPSVMQKYNLLSTDLAGATAQNDAGARVNNALLSVGCEYLEDAIAALRAFYPRLVCSQYGSVGDRLPVHMRQNLWASAVGGQPRFFNGPLPGGTNSPVLYFSSTEEYGVGVTPLQVVDSSARVVSCVRLSTTQPIQPWVVGKYGISGTSPFATGPYYTHYLKHVAMRGGGAMRSLMFNLAGDATQKTASNTEANAAYEDLSARMPGMFHTVPVVDIVAAVSDQSYVLSGVRVFGTGRSQTLFYVSGNAGDTTKSVTLPGETSARTVALNANAEGWLSF